LPIRPFAEYALRPKSKAVLASQGIAIPTAIQAETIPFLLDGRDVIGQAHTGSGKTLAFGLPLIEKCDPQRKGVQALVLTPTRELAQQVGQVLAEVATPSGFEVVVIYGGVGFQPQVDALKRGAQIVVGTPGRVLDHIGRGTLHLGGVQYLVLDEADEMLDRGFAPDVERILSFSPRDRQTALFSATTPEWVHNVASKYLHEPLVIRIGSDKEAEPDIDHTVIECWTGDKFSVLLTLLDEETEGATLVFGRTRYGVENLAKRLNRMGYDVAAIQGNLGQAARDKIIAQFRGGHVPVLLATNVAARGLDMLNIDRVINYDLPETPELFTHRVGRTGRIGRSGQAITLIAATDLQKMQEIERKLGRKLRRISSASLDLRPVKPTEMISRPPTPVAPPPAVFTNGDSAPAKRRRRRRRPAGFAAVPATE
jgi:ATP-dependent RNA helicase DeaD